MIRGYLQALKNNGGEELLGYQNITLDYVFRELSFGNSSRHQEIIKRFRDHPEHVKFDMVAENL